MVNKADEELLAQSAVMVGNEGENTPEEGAKEGAGGDSEGAVGEVNDEVADVSTDEAIVEKSATKSVEEWESMVAEAERRGYLRGRKERIGDG